MKNIDWIIEKCLQSKPETRDNDPLLYMEVAKVLGIENYSKYDLLTALSYQTVQRTRRKLQAEDPILRGESYCKRKHLEQEYRDFYSHNNSQNENN